MTGPDQELIDRIASITRELEGLELVKAERDRRLRLNQQLEQARAELASRQKRRAVEASIAGVEARMQSLGQSPEDKATRRELSKELAGLKAELDG